MNKIKYSIILHNVSKCYFDFKSNFLFKTINKIPFIELAAKKWPVRDLNITVAHGAVIGLTAPNKATLNILLNILTGNSAPSTGSVNVSRNVVSASTMLQQNTRETAHGTTVDRPEGTGPMHDCRKKLANLLKNHPDSILIFDDAIFEKSCFSCTEEFVEFLKTKSDNTTIVIASLDTHLLHATCTDVYDARGCAKGSDALREDVFLPFRPYAEACASPIAVGGVGGSGTRLIAGMLRDAGFHIGNDLNRADDNLWITLLFKEPSLLDAPQETKHALMDIFAHAMVGGEAWEKEHVDLVKKIASKNRPYCTKYWLKLRAKTLLTRNSRSDGGCAPFGWKEPNTHFFIDSFKEKYPNLKYIHVCRNGLDMAHSGNQNQVTLWGKYFIEGLDKIGPNESLKFWCIANKRVLHICEQQKIDHLVVNFDNLCTNTKEELSKIAAFLHIDYKIIEKYESIIKIPKSIGRFRSSNTEIFDRNDIAYVEHLGFDIR